MFRSLMLCWIICCITGTVKAQSSQELKQQQAEIQKDIADLKQQLSEAQKNTKAGLGQLNIILNQIRLREKSIANINAQINNIQRDINQSRAEIDELKKNVEALKEDYAKSVVYAYKNRNNYDFLNFIFAAASVNDALKRIEYLKSYRKYRETQAIELREKQQLLQEKISELEKIRMQQDEILRQQEQEKQKLVTERKDKDAIVARLRQQESQISKELKKKQDTDNKLKSAINVAINREIKLAQQRAAESEKASAATNNNTPSNNTSGGGTPARSSGSVFEKTPEGMAMTGNFENNKGKMPWPAEKATVKLPYGIYTVEGTSLRGNNPGLTIETVKNAPVKVVFDGVVSSVFEIDGLWGVMVLHGKYFSVYSGLSTASVSAGDRLTTGKVIGTAGSNADGNGEFEFLIYDEHKNLNPSLWLMKR